MPKRPAKPTKKTTATKKTPAQLHEAARVARRAGKSPDVVRGLLDEAHALERAA